MTPRRFPAACLGLTALLALGGCGSANSPAPLSHTSAAQEAPVPADLGQAPKVALLDAGAGTRRVLAFAPSAQGSTSTVVTTSASRHSTAQSAPNSVVPEQRTVLTSTAVPDVDGAQRLTATVTDFTSMDPQRNAQFATAKGFEVDWTRSADGAPRSLAYSAPALATDAARAAVEVLGRQLTDAQVLFPHSPVGLGARWTVTRAVDDAVAPHRVSTYTLTAIDGDQATVSVASSAPEVGRTLARPATADAPALTLDVQTYEVGGSGLLTVDLRSPFPREGTLHSTTKAVYADPTSGAQTAFDTTSDLTFSPR